MSWFLDDIINGFLNYSTAENSRVDANNQYYTSLRENMRQYNTSLNEMQRQYNTSLAFNQGQSQLQQQNWQKEFAQQQSNYENATQIRAADMQKAGLNPLLLAGGAEGSTPMSLGSSVSAPGPSGAPGATSVSGRGYNPFRSQLSLGLIDRYIESKERAKDRKSAEEIARINAEAQKYSADQSNESSHYGADTSAKTASEYLAFQKIKVGQEFGLACARYDSDELQRQFERGMAEKGLERQQARDVMDFVMHDKEIQIKLKQLQQAKEISDADRRMQYITRFGTELLSDITSIIEHSPLMAGKLGKEGIKKATDFFKKGFKNLWNDSIDPFGDYDF